MEKETVTKFDLEAAFKALDDLTLPDMSGKGRFIPNRIDLKERLQAKHAHEVLVEDYFDVSMDEDLTEAQEQREAEVAKAKLARIEKIVDLDAESEEDILPSYVGKIIMQCPQCMTLFYKSEEDIEKSEETTEVVNINEICQHCGNSSGYTLVGKVGGVEESEAANFDTEDFGAEEDELNLDFPEEGTEEIDAEGTGEGAEEMSEEDADLDLDLDFEEEPEEEETNESLHNSKMLSDMEKKGELKSDKDSEHLTLNEEINIETEDDEIREGWDEECPNGRSTPYCNTPVKPWPKGAPQWWKDQGGTDASWNSNSKSSGYEDEKDRLYREELAEAAEDEEIEIVDEAEAEPKQAIIECAKCGALAIVDEIEVDEESDLANIKDECKFCEEKEGYKIIGSVVPYETAEGDEQLDEAFGANKEDVRWGEIKDKHDFQLVTLADIKKGDRVVVGTKATAKGSLEDRDYVQYVTKVTSDEFNPSAVVLVFSGPRYFKAPADTKCFKIIKAKKKMSEDLGAKKEDVCWSEIKDKHDFQIVTLSDIKKGDRVVVGSNVTAKGNIADSANVQYVTKVTDDEFGSSAVVLVFSGPRYFKAPADTKCFKITKAKKKMSEDLADWYRKKFDKPASANTQQRWEDELNGEMGEISDKRRAHLERKFAQQRDYEAKHDTSMENQVTPIEEPVMAESVHNSELLDKIADKNDLKADIESDHLTLNEDTDVNDAEDTLTEDAFDSLLDELWSGEQPTATETKAALASFAENKDSETEEDFDEFDDQFDSQVTEYLSEVYENVEKYESTNCSTKDKKLVIEGIITFKSGKAKNTKFIFENKKKIDNKLIYAGMNESLSTKTDAFRMTCKAEGSKLISESFRYTYRINESLVKGSIK